MNIIGIVEQIVKKCCEGNEPGHDFNHVLRVRDLALEISKSVECDQVLVTLLALFHDINDHKLPNKASLKDVLETAHIVSPLKEKILYIVPFLSFSKYPTLPDDFPIEGKIVSDADRLDALGAVGIARAFSYGGSQNRSFEETLKHFDEKLLILDQYLYLDISKEMAKERMDFLREFYNRFKKESSLKKPH